MVLSAYSMSGCDREYAYRYYKRVEKVLEKISCLAVARRYPSEVKDLQRLFKTMALDVIFQAGDYISVVHALKIIRSKYHDLIQRSFLAESAIHVKKMFKFVETMNNDERFKFAVIINHCWKRGLFEQGILLDIVSSEQLTDVRLLQLSPREVLILARALRFRLDIQWLRARLKRAIRSRKHM